MPHFDEARRDTLFFSSLSPHELLFATPQEAGAARYERRSLDAAADDSASSLVTFLDACRPRRRRIIFYIENACHDFTRLSTSDILARSSRPLSFH